MLRRNFLQLLGALPFLGWVKPEKEIISAPILEIAPQAGGWLYITTTDGIYVFDRETTEVRKIAHIMESWK